MKIIIISSLAKPLKCVLGARNKVYFLPKKTYSVIFIKFQGIAWQSENFQKRYNQRETRAKSLQRVLTDLKRIYSLQILQTMQLRNCKSEILEALYLVARRIRVAIIPLRSEILQLIILPATKISRDLLPK